MEFLFCLSLFLKILHLVGFSPEQLAKATSLLSTPAGVVPLHYSVTLMYSFQPSLAAWVVGWMGGDYG